MTWWHGYGIDQAEQGAGLQRHGEVRGCRGMGDDQMVTKCRPESTVANKYGLLFGTCLQGVCKNGRKKLYFEFGQNILWVWCPYYKASSSSSVLQK